MTNSSPWACLLELQARGIVLGDSPIKRQIIKITNITIRIFCGISGSSVSMMFTPFYSGILTDFLKFVKKKKVSVRISSLLIVLCIYHLLGGMV